MKFTSKGIGWLIAGGIICASSVESDSISSAIGTMLLGFVFIAIYLMKQYFVPKGIGWFIAGGIFVAFSVETALGVTGELFRNSFLNRDDLSTTLIGIVIAAGCMYAFYRRNKREVDSFATGAGIDVAQDDPGETEGQGEVVVDAVVPEAPESGNSSDVEFEIDTKEE